MKECDILGVKTYFDPSYIFSGFKTPTRQDLHPCLVVLTPTDPCVVDGQAASSVSYSSRLDFMQAFRPTQYYGTYM